MKKIKKILTAPLLCLVACCLSINNNAFALIENPAAGSLGTGIYNEKLAIALANVIKSTFVLGSIAFVLYFAWGALRWMTAEGDKSKFEEGRSKISNAAIGLILLASTYAIITLLGNIFNIDFLKDLIFEFPTP